MEPTKESTPATLASSPAPKRARRSWALRFDAADGSALTIRASRNRDGSARTEVSHGTAPDPKTRKRTTTRGATEQHATMEAATKRQSELAAQATKLGWRQREVRGGGFVRRADAFDAAHLPAPGKSAKK